MKLIFIYGPPAAGKLTVARELAKITSFAIFDDHPAINSLQDVFGDLPQSMDKVVEQIRLAVLEEAARENVDLIFTFAYAHPDDMPYVRRICEAVERHDGAVCLVQLTCSSDAQEARVMHLDRDPTKSVDSVEIVREWNARYALRTPIPERSSLSIDNTHLPAALAARQIAERYQLRGTR
jgi:tRNA uridine 5-carbamoylmethylation protein Kti12